MCSFYFIIYPPRGAAGSKVASTATPFANKFRPHWFAPNTRKCEECNPSDQIFGNLKVSLNESTYLYLLINLRNWKISPHLHKIRITPAWWLSKVSPGNFQCYFGALKSVNIAVKWSAVKLSRQTLVWHHWIISPCFFPGPLPCADFLMQFEILFIWVIFFCEWHDMTAQL